MNWTRHAFLRVSIAASIATMPLASSAQQTPGVRPLGATTARASLLLGSAATVRPLPGGRLLVNDTKARRLVIFDSTLAQMTIVLDSEKGRWYGRNAGGLISYADDSSLFVAFEDRPMLIVIDPKGAISRKLALPFAMDAVGLVGLVSGAPGFDAERRVVYLGKARIKSVARETSSSTSTQPTDSCPLIRVQLDGRGLDTAGWVRIPHLMLSAAGNGRFQSLINPLPVVDAWAMLKDGSIAIVRGDEYRIDWVNPGGTRSSSAPIPFEWRRLTREDKLRFIDSTRSALERLRSEETARDPVNGPRAPFDFLNANGIPTLGAFQVRGVPAAGPTPLLFVEPKDLPDRVPPFAQGAARGDTDGNLWVRTTSGFSGGPIYDVIDRHGRLIDRVYVPPRRVIVGFGLGGVVYMVVQEKSGVRLERARYR